MRKPGTKSVSIFLQINNCLSFGSTIHNTRIISLSNENIISKKKSNKEQHNNITLSIKNEEIMNTRTRPRTNETVTREQNVKT